jgi:hypothetical protein
LSEKQKNVTEGLKKLGDMANQYKDALISAFKDMDVEVKEWNFAASKVEKQYNVEVSVKLSIKPKTPEKKA